MNYFKEDGPKLHRMTPGASRAHYKMAEICGRKCSKLGISSNEVASI